MRVALAQVRSETGRVDANIERHLAVLRALPPGAADLVAFPELSLTNYAPEVAGETALAPDDPRLAGFQRFADATGTAVAVGAPLRTGDPLRTGGAPVIGVLTFAAGRAVTVTGKQHLHPDEVAVFSPSDERPGVLALSARVGVAICYELSVRAHTDALAAAGADVVLVSAAKTARGVADARATLAETARRIRRPVLLVNSVGTCDGERAGGGSFALSADGRCLGELGDDPGVLWVDTAAGTARAERLH